MALNIESEFESELQALEHESALRMGVVRKKIKNFSVFFSLLATMALKTFKCAACDVVVESVHMHCIQSSFRDELAALAGKKLPFNGLCCCAHFEPHDHPRFTKLHPAILKKHNATPIYTTPPKRLSRAVDRSRTPVVLKKPPAADRERKLKQRIADLESQVQVLESRVKELDQPLLARLVPKLSDGKNLGEEDEESLQYWLGVRSSDSVSQFLDSFPTETRGRNSKLSDSDWVTVTLMWLRRGLPQKTLSLFTSVDRSNVTRHIEDVIDYMNLYVNGIVLLLLLLNFSLLFHAGTLQSGPRFVTSRWTNGAAVTLKD